MSTNTISASNLFTPAAAYAPAAETRRLEGGDRDSSGESSPQGITLLASLLQALTQAASAQPTTAATPAAGAAGTAAAAATPSAASTTSTSGTNSAGTASNTASGTSLVQDLQAFLHDLFGALRHAGRSHHGGREHGDDDHTAATSAPATATAATTPTPAAGATATTPTAGAAATISTTPADPATGATATSSSSASAVGSATTTTGAAAYGRHSIVSELNALIQDLGQTAGNPGSSSGLSSRRLSNLNSAFEKLIGDLRGASSAGSSTPSAGSSTPSAGGGAPSGSAAAGQSTSALQAFLTNFLQDLQANGAQPLSPVGSSINTTA